MSAQLMCMVLALVGCGEATNAGPVDSGSSTLPGDAGAGPDALAGLDANADRDAWVDGPVVVDCRAADDSCPRIVIAGALDSLGVAAGEVDPAIRRDPSTGRLLMSYTFVSSQDADFRDIGASVHLAESGDDGRTWSFVTAPWPSQTELDPNTGGNGYGGHEVSALTSHRGNFYGAHLRFHDPAGGGNNRRSDSFLIELSRAASADELGGSFLRVAGNLASSAWGIDVRLSDLAPQLARCTLFVDPVLFSEDDRLYFLANCIVYDGGVRRPEEGLYGAFEVLGPEFDGIEFLGVLADSADAAALGAEELSKGKLVRARDGALLFLTAPVSRGARFEEYVGCYVYEVVSLDPPLLRRDVGGTLEPPRMIIRSSDSTPSSASCNYHPDSETGIVLTRRELRPELGRLEWSLHATHAHP